MPPDSYITLTPTATSSSSHVGHVTLINDLLVRKWAVTAKRRASEEHEAEDRQSFRTDTDRSSRAGNGEALKVSTGSKSESEAEELEAVEDQGRVHIPTYLCDLHDPKPVLVAEQIPCNRVDIRPCETIGSLAGLTETLVFRYEISVGKAQQIFECSPYTTLKVIETLSRDTKCADQLRFIEMNCLRGGIIGSLKRMYASAVQVSTEIRDVLEAISDVDSVLMTSTYRDLVGATKGSALCQEMEKLLESHRNTLLFGSRCMCDTYYKSVKRYGEFYREQALTANQVRQSTVVSETLMRSRGVLSYYTDTIYIMDKREFRPTHGLKRCNVYGFGRRKLFEIVRMSRKQWSLCHVNYGEIFTLSLKKYVGSVHHMVAVKRMVPCVQNGGLRQENVCFVKKSKSQGYRCLLMSEVISQGKVTTSISIQKPKPPPGDTNFHYMTISEVSGPSPASICSSTLSVPCERYKYLQRLNVSGGSDVVTYIALAVSYDILVGALSYWMERKY